MKVKLKGFNMAYVCKGAGENILFIHGNNESHHSFDTTIDILKNHFTCYGIDLRGQGNSKCEVVKYHYEDLAQDVFDFINKLDIKDVSICGFSDGAIIATILAIKYPYLIKNLVLCGGNINPLGLKDEAIKEINKDLRACTNDNDRKLLELMLEEPNIKANSLNSITSNTLVLAGSEDLIKLDHTILIASNIKNSKIKIIEKEDHSSYIIGSNKLALEIIDFIKQ